MHRLLVAATQDRKFSCVLYILAHILLPPNLCGLSGWTLGRLPCESSTGNEILISIHRSKARYSAPHPSARLAFRTCDGEPKAESVSTSGPSLGHTLGNTHQPNAAETGNNDPEPGHSAQSTTERKPDRMKFESRASKILPSPSPQKRERMGFAPDGHKARLITSIDIVYFESEKGSIL